MKRIIIKIIVLLSALCFQCLSFFYGEVLLNLTIMLLSVYVIISNLDE